MIIVDKILTKFELEQIKNEFGNYSKITADIKNKWLIVGCELHADGEKLLLEKGSLSDNIWGGGINLRDKIIDTTAVLNLRPRLSNDSMEILDPQKHGEFINCVKEYFSELWH